MTPEEIDQVRVYLRDRITQAKRWEEDTFPGEAFTDFKESIQGHLCKVRPLKFVDLNEPAVVRKQGQGVRFLLTWGESSEQAAAVDVLLAPEADTNKRVGLGPWVKVKAVDPTAGNKISSKLDIIAPWLKLDDCDGDLPIDEFFKTWLRRAFNSDKKEKIFDYRYPTSSD